MVYGAEAVLPSEVRYEAPRVVAYKQGRTLGWKIAWTCWMKLETLLLPDPRCTSRAYAIITVVEFDIEFLLKEIRY